MDKSEVVAAQPSVLSRRGAAEAADSIGNPWGRPHLTSAESQAWEIQWLKHKDQVSLNSSQGTK